MKFENKYFIPLLLILFLFLGISAYAEVNIPDMPRDFVVDLADVISPDLERALNVYLLELEQKTTAQVLILTIKSLEGESLEDFSIYVAHDKWQLGQKDKDNGVLLLAAIRERDARIEVGYGLEGFLTDAYSRRIIEQRLKPYFNQGEYSNGIVAAAEVLISEIAADAGVQITGQAVQRGGESPKESTLLQKIFSVLLVIGGIYLFIRHPRLFILLLLMTGGGRRGGWGGGGGFSSGGGTFGGGGGGGFGGGGASGGW
ncbi:MAG: TPM domain-containing protein [Acidobacteria bacterium]|nr:TPM domain-containing protein [Acidobacteriota bacterium]